MHIEFLVEEQSAEVALQNLLPRMTGNAATYRIHPFQGKPDLLAKLPQRLRGYASWMPADWRIVVLVDQDRDNCVELKQRLERTAAEAGLTTKSTAAARNQRLHVINRIAVEELESWYFGDTRALVEAYPGVPTTLDRKAPYRDPDGIRGGTWEALERVLQRAGYYPGGLLKIEAARVISRHMAPEPAQRGRRERRRITFRW
ncbi:MAG TPA: DUF4276 family protein [Firmicutes bacterium]|nr:DUF4276 family protein [Bacillota bacterium]